MPTYDFKPEMSAAAAADAFVGQWAEGAYRFGVVNFANPDMVGHTGVIPAAVKAVETVDAQLGRVVEAVEAKGGVCIITADHGNCRPHARARRRPQHRALAQPGAADRHPAEGLDLRYGGILADVAPTALDLLGIAQPAPMTGRTLID